ncbi:NAD(P)H-dependent oxidoreductase [Pseudochelatococcus sp. B33]
MHALVVLSHPEPQSFSRAVADRFRAGVELGGIHTSELADLAAEGFDPRFSLADLAHFREEGPLPADAAREQERVERADALALVFPVYWWGMPALLKGWIDRVFTNGWAYDYALGGKANGRLPSGPVHLLGIGASDLGGFARHGYDRAIETQISEGIFHYCGVRDVHLHLLLDVEGDNTAAFERNLQTAHDLGRRVFAREEAPAGA